MKPIKKFSTISNGATKSADSILESANLSPEALAELVQKLGYNNIDEVKKEKALLSKLEALLKEFTPKQDISEEDIEEDRAEDIEDEIVDMGEPKSLEDEEGEKEEDKEVGGAGEVSEEDVEEDKAEDIEDEILAKGEPEDIEDKAGKMVSDDPSITDEVPAEGDDEEAGKDVEVEEETEEKPVAKRRIMTFEDFCTEKEETINKNISYRDDEEEEDYAVPVAEEDGEDKEEEIEHDRDAAKDDYAHIEDLKKDAADDKEEEDELEEESFNHSTSGIKSFSQFVSEGYEEEDDSEDEEVTEEADNGPELKEETPDDNGIALKIAKGDGPETAAGIAGDIMDMGKPKEEPDSKGEELVTKDQPITKAPETSKDEPNVQGTVVVKEEEEVEAEEEEAVEEATISEKEIKSDAEFEEYATAILKQAHGDKFDEAKAKEVIDGLKSKYSGDYGAMVGALQSSMGESVTFNEAKNTNFKVGDLVWVNGIFLPKDIKWEIVNISDVKSGEFKGETKYSLRSALNPKVTTVIYGGEQLKAWDKPGNGMKPKGSGSYIK